MMQVNRKRSQEFLNFAGNDIGESDRIMVNSFDRPAGERGLNPHEFSYGT